MLFSRKSEVAGTISHPGTRWFLPSVDLAQLQALRRSVHASTLTFKAITQNTFTAGGSHGDEFCPD